MRRRFSQVDVFGQGSFKGNPLGVVLDGTGLDAVQMADYARWSNLSEVTFVLPASSQSADYRFRIFAGEQEFPFAGHPALGTASAWLASGGVPHRPGMIHAECAAGIIPIAVQGERLSFAAPPLHRGGPLDPGHLAALCALLGLGRHEVLDAAWVDNGPGWAALLLQDANAVLAVQPQPASRPGRWKAGLLGALPVGTAERFEVRALSFADGVVREDPVTGSLNAAAAGWLVDSGRATLPFSNRQGTLLGRRGRVDFHESGGLLWAGGTARGLIEGTIEL